MDAETETLDADRKVALAQVPPAARAAVGALWRLDAALGAVIAGAREPMIGRIKLAWWRESLEALDRSPPPGEPLLRELAADLLPAGVPGAEAAGIVAGWEVLLSPDPLGAAELDRYASERGGHLFRLSVRLIGGETAPWIEQAGGAWALADLARHSNPTDAAAALVAAGPFLDGRRWPAALRPLGMLAVLAERDVARGIERLEPPGVPPRIARMLRHRITGR